MNKIHKIPGQNLGKLQKKIEALARRAAKLGSPDVGMEILEGYQDITNPDGTVTRLCRVRITGEAPRLNGWRFVAKLQHLSEGNVVRAVPGEDVPGRFSTAEPWCEHCNTRRHRKDTFVVARGDEYKQVGSSCLADFTGHGSPNAAAKAAECLVQAIELCDEATADGWADGPRGAYLLKIEVYLAYAATEIRRNGWTPRRVEIWSSADSALVTMLDKDPYHDGPTERDWQMARDALTWVREELATRERLNDYDWNLVTACADDVITIDLIGIVASLIPTYGRALERKAEAEAEKRAESQYVGTVGERTRFDDLTVIAVIPLPGQFGITNLHKFRDPDGNVLVWFASNAELERGFVYGGKATVKAHNEYRGCAQTVLTRCKFEACQEG